MVEWFYQLVTLLGDNMHTTQPHTTAHTTFKSSAAGKQQTLARREMRMLKRGR